MSRAWPVIAPTPASVVVASSPLLRGPGAMKASPPWQLLQPVRPSK